ncbi:MAG: acyltransferase [Pedobacter sp.]|jgi:peptidoglycan/LPS O-acetylase OafA/YrhL|uniref:acyltransferase family protein n=1 Tax=Pedobacter sp. TaxID=1411316 RepID=UPI003566DBFB
MVKQPSQINYGIQYLRSLAALGVLLCHYGSDLKNYPELAFLLSFGKLGVHIFFLISGYIITLSLLNYNYYPKHFFKFLLKRSVRIEPVYIITILLTLFSFYLFNHFSSFKGGDLPFIPGQFFAHVFYIVPFTKWSFYNNIFWTLGVEFQFYLLMGCVYFIKNSMFFRIIFLILFSLTVFIPFANATNLLSNYGAIFALGISSLHFQQSRNKWYLSIMILDAIIIYLHDGYLILFLLTISILIIYLFKYKIAILNFLGKISYSLYVIHPLIFIYINGITKKTIPNLINYELLFLCVQITTALGLAYVFYLLIEKPTIAISKKIVYR